MSSTTPLSPSSYAPSLPPNTQPKLPDSSDPQSTYSPVRRGRRALPHPYKQGNSDSEPAPIRPPVTEQGSIAALTQIASSAFGSSNSTLNPHHATRQMMSQPPFPQHIRKTSLSTDSMPSSNGMSSIEACLRGLMPIPPGSILPSNGGASSSSHSNVIQQKPQIAPVSMQSAQGLNLPSGSLPSQSHSHFSSQHSSHSNVVQQKPQIAPVPSMQNAPGLPSNNPPSQYSSQSNSAHSNGGASYSNLIPQKQQIAPVFPMQNALERNLLPGSLPSQSNSHSSSQHSSHSNLVHQQQQIAPVSMQIAQGQNLLPGSLPFHNSSSSHHSNSNYSYSYGGAAARPAGFPFAVPGQNPVQPLPLDNFTVTTEDSRTTLKEKNGSDYAFFVTGPRQHKQLLSPNVAINSVNCVIVFIAKEPSFKNYATGACITSKNNPKEMLGWVVTHMIPSPTIRAFHVRIYHHSLTDEEVQALHKEIARMTMTKGISPSISYHKCKKNVAIGISKGDAYSAEPPKKS